jgi:hypothetical protein
MADDYSNYFINVKTCGIHNDGIVGWPQGRVNSLRINAVSLCNVLRDLFKIAT